MRTVALDTWNAPASPPASRLLDMFVFLPISLPDSLWLDNAIRRY
jgi:hypothetical protein